MSITDIYLKSSDRNLMANLLQEGGERRRAEEEFFRNYSYFIGEATRKYSISEDEAFDAYSDSVLIGFEKIRNHSFEGRSSIKTWLFQIFHNKCVDLLRKKTTNKYSVHQTQSISDMLFQLSDETKLVIDELAGKTDMDLLKRKLEELGENCKQMLLYWADGTSDKQIAVQLSYKTADVVKTSRLRCLEKLRQLYKHRP
jgi:RNA polymerase sigma factor (sigma-70 family)